MNFLDCLNTGIEKIELRGGLDCVSIHLLSVTVQIADQVTAKNILNTYIGGK